MGRAELRDELKARGYRLTPQRQLVLEAVQRLEHATPDVILREVQSIAPAVNITTVYRTLELLEDLHLVRHTHLDHGAPNYHLAGDEHVHLVCRGCGDVSEVGPELVDAMVGRLLADRGFQVDVGHLAVFGTCSRCR